MNTPTPDDRIEVLEVKLAHLERALQELSDVIYRQQRRLDAADERHQQLLDRLSSTDPGTDEPAQFEVPPHY